MAEFSTIREAREMSGMRLIVAEGLPGPWAEGIRGILELKKIPYSRGRFELDSDHEDLISWTSQSSVPVIVWNDEFPKSGWLEQIFLTERIQPEPSVIPVNITERVTMFGMLNELCAPAGFAWCRRLMLIHMGLNNPELPHEQKLFFKQFGEKYGYSEKNALEAPQRVINILNMLTTQLKFQASEGRNYFIGESISALDIYWAGMSHLIELMPPEDCPIIEEFRPFYQNIDPNVAEAGSKELMKHREFIYRKHLGLPMDI